jgi:FkbM family methyltransferase
MPIVKKRFFLSLAVKYKIFYKIYLYYNIYIRNFKYIFQKSYSQFNDDIFIKKFFKNKYNGIYIDIGCHHPFKLNNTYLLHKNGWSGLNIDLIQLNIDLFKIARPKDKNICCAISNKNETCKVYIPNGNILSTEISIKKDYADIIKKHHKNSYIIQNIKTITFEEILKKFKIKINSFDFLKIDIEGKDYDVLRNINLKKYRPKLICVEDSAIDNKNSNKIKNYLESIRYKLCFKTNVNSFFAKI